MRLEGVLRLLPPPRDLATPFALLLGLELLFNRILTRVSLFLPQGAAAPMDVVSAFGMVLMAAVALLGFLALASVVLRWEGPLGLRAAVLIALLVLLGSLALPAAGAPLVLGVLLVILIALLVSAVPHWSDALFAILLAGGFAAIVWFHVAPPSVAGAPAYVVGEVLVLFAIAYGGARAWRGRLDVPAVVVATSVTAFLAVLYLRVPAGFSAVSFWSLGFGLFLPPLFFLAVWLSVAGFLTERSRGAVANAATLAILLFAGLDFRVSYVAAALLFAASLRYAAVRVDEAPSAARAIGDPRPQAE